MSLFIIPAKILNAMAATRFILIKIESKQKGSK
jgi:hypothetical protein